MSDTRAMPTATLLLGAAGAVPFITSAVTLYGHFNLPLLGPEFPLHTALKVYAIAILAFLGGIRWGLAMGYPEPGKAVRDYIVSVIPALVGTLAFFAVPNRDLWILAVAFLALGLFDYGLVCRTIAAQWFGNLRLALTGIVVLSLVVAALA